MASLTPAEIQTVLDAWPATDDDLPTTVKTAFDAWFALRMPEINVAVQALTADPASGFTTPGRRLNKLQKCRALAAHGVETPSGGPAPSPEELRSMLPTSDDAVSAKIRMMEAQLVQQRDLIASLVRQQNAIDAERDVTADYEIHEKVLSAVPATFLDHDPLSKKERRKIMRDHQGLYPDGKWPNKLALKTSTKTSKDMQKAQKLTLPQYATEVSKFAARNDFTTKMAGTAWSRALDMKSDLESSLDSDPDAWYRADEILEQVLEVAACTEGAFTLGLDMSVNMRLNVANRVDIAMGINHLRVDPFKKETDDFISADTYKLVEKEAKERQNLTWAKQGHFAGSRAGHFFGQPTQKSPGPARTARRKGGGQGSRGRGSRGRGGNGGRGRGRGRGVGNDNNNNNKNVAPSP